jgi:protein-disulfide isomerase/uncharacterized membrane protein
MMIALRPLQNHVVMLNNMIKTKPLYFNLLFTIISIGVLAYLTNKFFLLQSAESSGQSFCNLGGIWNCDAVNSSPYSRLFGYPMGLWGLVTNVVFLLCQVMVLIRPKTQPEAQNYWVKITGLAALFIAGTSVVMGSLSITKIGSVCLFCLIVYILSFVSLILLAFAGISYKQALKSLFEVFTNKATWFMMIAVPVLVFIIGQNWGSAMNSNEVKAFTEDRYAAWKAAPPAQFDPQLGLRLGASPENTKMTIIEFADFRCPHCKHAAPSIKAFVQSRNDVALLFKTYPLDGTCNLDPAFGGQGDGISCRLAFAVMCAEKLEQKGWMLYDSIFENQFDYHQLTSVDQTDKKLCESGISDCAKFKTCMDDEGTRVMIQKMAQEGTQSGLKGTPTFFVNNKLLNGAQFLPVMEKVYDDIKGQ